MVLTIAIPTYNRAIKVKNTVKQLLPQLTNNTKILILDNASDVDVRSYLHEQLGTGNLANVNVIRHKVNIGPDANFARCFELCDTPYIWLLGDDDDVDENAVNTIFLEIDNFKMLDLIGFDFFSNCCVKPRKDPVIIQNTNDLVKNIDFNNFLFMSTCVFKTQEYLKYLKYAAWGAYSMASQLVPALLAISNNKVLVLSEKKIVDNVWETSADQKWSDAQITLGLSTLLEAPIKLRNNEHRLLGEKFYAQLMSYTWMLYSILKSINCDLSKVDNYHIYIYKQAYYRTITFKKAKLKNKIFYYSGLTLLKNKILFALILKLNRSWFNKKLHEVYEFILFKR